MIFFCVTRASWGGVGRGERGRGRGGRGGGGIVVAGEETGDFCAKFFQFLEGENEEKINTKTKWKKKP